MPLGTPRFHVDGTPLSVAELPSNRAFNGEVVQPVEFRCVIDDARDRIASMCSAPVFGLGGEIVAAVSVIQDITEARAHEAEQLRLREEERLAKVAAKSQADFLANMSHELRSPGMPRGDDTGVVYCSTLVLAVISIFAVHGILGLVELLALTFADPHTDGVAAAAPSSTAVAKRHKAGSKHIHAWANSATQRQYCTGIRECATLLQSLVSSVLVSSVITVQVSASAL